MSLAAERNTVAGHKWAPIEDIPAGWKAIASQELARLGATWRERSRRDRDAGVLDEFDARLAREWAIETGIIEGLYTIDRGITQVLVEKGIDAALIPDGATYRPAAQIVTVLEDHQDALEGVFALVTGERALSTSYIKELHQVLTRHQDTVAAIDGMGRRIEVALVRGDWKRQPNNPTRPNGDVHEYCPPEHVAAEMDRLIAMHGAHRAAEVPAEVEAAWLHHRFTEIHPFQDGNGRIARALASLVFLRAGWFPLVIDRDIRGEYIRSLERADDGELAARARLFADIEMRAAHRAMSTA